MFITKNILLPLHKSIVRPQLEQCVQAARPQMRAAKKIRTSALPREQGSMKLLRYESKKSFVIVFGPFSPFLPAPRSVSPKAESLRFRNSLGSYMTITQASNSNFGRGYKYRAFFLKPIVYNNFYIPITFRLPLYLSEETIAGKQIYHGKMALILMSLKSDWGILRKWLF